MKFCRKALVLTFCSLPILAFARQRDDGDSPTPLMDTSLQMEANENASLVQSTENGRKKVRLLGELAELRESNAKHFLYSDGTVRCAVYEQDVHYLDENGLWQDIDNTLTFVEDENGRYVFSSQSFVYDDKGRVEQESVFLPASVSAGETLDRWYVSMYTYTDEGELSAVSVIADGETVSPERFPMTISSVRQARS